MCFVDYVADKCGPVYTKENPQVSFEGVVDVNRGIAELCVIASSSNLVLPLQFHSPACRAEWCECGCGDRVSSLLPLCAETLRHKHYPQHLNLLETLLKLVINGSHCVIDMCAQITIISSVH